MPSQKDITLYQGHATPQNIILRELPTVGLALIPIYLYAGHATPQNIILRDPTIVYAPPPTAAGPVLRMLMGLGI